MGMRIRSVNVGRARELGGSRTGIFKTPVDHPVMVTVNGLAGDTVYDRRHHGGADQAVYVYGQHDYNWWERQLGRSVPPGSFGDNLTIEGLSSRDLYIGDRLTSGDLTLQVTAPRIPCATLGRRMNDSRFPIGFRRAELPGCYCRVLTEGLASPRVRVSLIQPEPGEDEARISLIELFKQYYEPSPDKAWVQRVLASPVAERERTRLTRLVGT